MSATSAFIATIERGQARSRVCETSTGLLVPQVGQSRFPLLNGEAQAGLSVEAVRKG